MCSNCALRSGCCAPSRRLAIGLQAVAQFPEQPGHHLHTRLMALLRQCRYEVALAARRPPQRRLGIAPRRGFDQRLQVRQQGRILRPARDPGGPRHQRNSTVALRHRFARHEQAPRPLVQQRPHSSVALGNLDQCRWLMHRQRRILPRSECTAFFAASPNEAPFFAYIQLGGLAGQPGTCQALGLSAKAASIAWLRLRNRRRRRVRRPVRRAPHRA